MISSLLPDIPGVRPLTRSEIKKDFGIIEANYDSDNSDVSVSSGEAISSSYPVKPRNFAKAPRREIELQAMSIPQSHIDIGGGISMDDAIAFMKAVEVARPEIFEAERQRENLEIRYQAIREMSLSKSKSFLGRKKEQKNFIRAAQGMCRNRLNYFGALCQKNSMLYDLIVSLQQKKQAISMLKNCFSSLEENSKSNLLQKITDNDINQDAVHFYKHQSLSTPMGEGTIININVKEEMLAIRISFGVMYSTFASVASWVSDAPNAMASLDRNHADNLCHRWLRELRMPRHTIGMSEKRREDINRLLQPIVPSLSNKDLFGTPELDDINKKATLKTRRSTSRHKSIKDDDHDATTCNDSCTKGGKLAGADLFLKRKYESKHSILLDHTDKLPLLYCPPGIAPLMVSGLNEDAITKKSLDESLVQQSNCEKLLPIQAEYCANAFHHSTPVKFFCDIEPPTERGDDENSHRLHESDECFPKCRLNDFSQHLSLLKENLRPLHQQIKGCRKRKQNYARQVEHTKRNTANLIEQISKVRLGMFTQRVLFRQNAVHNSGKKKSSTKAKSSSDIHLATSVAAGSDNNTKANDSNSSNMKISSTENSRRKSTRVASNASSSSSTETLQTSRNKRKKDDLSKEEGMVVNGSTPFVVPAAATNTTKSSNSQSVQSASRRNPKRLRR